MYSALRNRRYRAPDAESGTWADENRKRTPFGINFTTAGTFDSTDLALYGHYWKNVDTSNWRPSTALNQQVLGLMLGLSARSFCDGRLDAYSIEVSSICINDLFQVFIDSICTTTESVT